MRPVFLKGQPAVFPAIARTVVVSAVAVLLFLLAGHVWLERHMNNSAILNAAFLKYLSATAYDPAKIQFAPEYIFLENIYSTLIETDTGGETVSGLAERFVWKGPELHFTMRPDLKTVDGRLIDARDAEVSFKRILILNGGTHTDLANMLCAGATLRGIGDACPGMEVRDNNSVFVLKLKKKNIAVLKMLAAMDLAVIPRGSLDEKTLAIKDYRNTSGPYYVAEDGQEGRITLKTNPAHYHYKKNIPQVVNLVPSGKGGVKESLELFEAGKVDHVMASDRAMPELLIDYAQKHPESTNLHVTTPFKLHMLVFTRKGLARFSEKERFGIGRGLRRIYLEHAMLVPDTEAAEQVIPPLADGALTGEQLAALKSITDAVPVDAVSPQKILAWNLSIPNLFAADEAELRKYFPGTRVEISRNIPAFTDFGKEGIEEPDLVFLGIDMGFEESIGRMTYMANAGLFPAPGTDLKDWARRYTSTEEKTSRIQLSRELNYSTLVHAGAIPLTWSPYAAIIRKPWKMGFSKMYPNSHLWRISQD